MLNKKQIVEKAYELGFGDIGFTTATPFEDQRKVLEERKALYQWALDAGLDLMSGVDPKSVLPSAKTIIVLMEVYFNEAYPSSLEPYFGRCYLDDDRIMKDRLAVRIKAFRSFLREHEIDSKVPFHLPHRVAAARAGMGNFGKNCLFYSHKVVRQGSWVLPIAVVVDREFEPGIPTIEVGCPDWCKNACIVACPTGALKGPRKIDPRQCISYLTYFGEGMTPMALREPMGLWVYGCDRCQNVCPRNAPWLAKQLPLNKKVADMVDDFNLSNLLHMDHVYFNKKVWPHMFYMSDQDIWRWKMNVARSMGNSLDDQYVPDLIKAFQEFDDERVRGIIAWALGRIGGKKAGNALEAFLKKSEDPVKGEIELALEKRP
jgi:epoxyqueuosine reductase